MNAAVTDDEKRLQFGWIHGTDKNILLMGIPAATWDELKAGKGQDIDLTPMGIPLNLVIFGAADKAGAVKFIEEAGKAMGIKFEEQPAAPPTNETEGKPQ